MHARHLLFSRPWQFDRKILHDCNRNKYTLEKDRQKFTLTPLTLQQVYKDQLRILRGFEERGQNEKKEKVISKNEKNEKVRKSRGLFMNHEREQNKSENDKEKNKNEKDKERKKRDAENKEEKNEERIKKKEVQPKKRKKKEK